VCTSLVFPPELLAEHQGRLLPPDLLAEHQGWLQKELHTRGLRFPVELKTWPPQANAELQTKKEKEERLRKRVCV